MAPFKKANPKHSSYQVCVTILEARHLQQNANPMVMVKVGNRKRRTVVRESTDCPVFNEYFVFDIALSLEELLSTKISIAVYLRRRLRRLRLYGNIVFELAAVWDQPDHQYYHKWAMLTDPKDPAAGSRGYVKCNITINAKGEKVRVHPETDGEDDIEGNLLLPLGGEAFPYRQRARYTFVVYRADGLPDMSSMWSRSDVENLNSYVQISFAGMKGKTKIGWQSFSPKFNDRIVFKDTFPPFSHRMRIAVKHRIDSCRSCVVAGCVLNLKKISNSGEHGFLPTYGPSFIHLYGYGSTERNGCSSKCAIALPIYRGRLLLSLKTEIDGPEGSPRSGVETTPTAPIIENSLWKTEEYLLTAILYDVCMLDRRRFTRKLISFEISIGNYGNRQFPRSQCFNDNDGAILVTMKLEKRTDFENQTTPQLSENSGGKYNYLPFGAKKPCMYIKSWWPNLEWRIYNSNSLRFIANFLETKLEKVEALAAIENPTSYETYNETIRVLTNHCMRYLHILNTGRYNDEGGTTKLDRQRVNICRERIEDVLRRIKINGELPNNHYVRIAMIHGYRYLRKIRELCEDPQDSLPDVFVWMMAGSKRVAYSRVSAHQIIYSEESTEKGDMCGKRINVFMKSPMLEDEIIDYSASKIELFLWLGNAKFASACWSSIPSGYEMDYGEDVDVFPKFFQYVQSSTFQLRAHIFQGRFDPGMDTSNLLDPLVRVTFYEHTSTTRVIKQSTEPFWDQTLIFPSVTIYGTKEQIKLLPPQVVVQIFNRNVSDTKEFCGRCMVVPLVKLATETYTPPDFPPKLEWYKFQSQRDCSGSVLAAFELIETGDKDVVDVPMTTATSDNIYNIPDNIKPKMVSYRLEVIFWGVRDMKKICYLSVNKPRIIIECGGVLIKSEVMENAKKFCNFEKPHIIVELDMPELEIYYPSVTIRGYDSRGFGCFKYAGICVIPTVYVFLEQLITEEDYQLQIHEMKATQKYHPIRQHVAAVLPLPATYDPSKEESEGLIPYKKMARKKTRSRFRRMLTYVKRLLRRKILIKKKRPESYGIVEDKSLDWWSKYFASLEEERSKELGVASTISIEHKPVATFKVYSTELELQPQFKGFQDSLTTFELWRDRRSKSNDCDDENYAGKFKGHISVYRWPHPDNLPCKTKSGRNLANGLCDDHPPPEPVKLLVRLYVIKGINLQPKDPLSGKSDPYLCVRLGKRYHCDVKNYVPNQLNPTFGRIFELDAILPQDYLLTVQVWDYDATTTDDLIGETQIDIENRFYSKHRATCGISKIYNTSGYNAWRDREKPTYILEFLCRKNNLPLPEYEDGYVTIGKRRFPFNASIDSNEKTDRQEFMAVNVLHQWEDFPICGCALVPEHVERRPLFNASRPGLEQGKLELWIDMFQVGQLPPKPAVNITPHAPEEYEIRAIVWNTEDVPLIESQFLTGEKSSDIYVKGWILYEDYQKTDVHYNSLTGEGNFNWRFVFRVTYSKDECVMIVRQKMSIFARSETEQKLPCRLHLQVWDSDHFSADDFLGALTLDLSRMPRGSANSKTCTLKLLEPQLPTVNLFKMTRIKAWWPLVHTTKAGLHTQAGKIELELSVLRAADADDQPAGRGRAPPQNLPPPNRPDTSFSWFRNPWKACRYVVCRYYKWRIIFCFLCVLLVVLVACGVYAFPGYFVKRLLGA